MTLWVVCSQRKSLLFKINPFTWSLVTPFQSSSSQLIESGAECTADIIRAPCKVSISTSSVYNSTNRRQQKDKKELGECYVGQSLKSEAWTTVSSAQFPSTALRDNVTMISETQSEVKQGALYTAAGTQNAPLPQSGRVNFAPKMTSNLYNYRSAGIRQHYFPDKKVDEPGPNHAPKMAPVSLLYPYALKGDNLFLPRTELSKF